MAYSYGDLTYYYQVNIDLENIVDKIAEKIGHMDDGYCWEVDDNKLIISARHTTGYKHWHYNATMDSPAEDDIELCNCVDSDIDVEVAVLNALQEIKSVNAEIEIDDDYDYLDYGDE